MMEATSPSAPLNKCPQCGYDLRGLPADHRCPECGLAYDHQTEIFRPRKPRIIFVGLLGFLGGMGGMINMLIRSLQPGSRSGIFSVLMFMVWLGLGVYLFLRLNRIYQRGQFVMIGPDGMHYRLQSPECSYLSWSQIGSIKPQRYDKLCRVIKTQSGGELIIAGVFSTPRDVERFVELVNRRLMERREGERCG
ncbi:MAG: hypothetical protein HJJLKODD_00003 [Phycisphaerae bacterium]|nr:hypothetical protein [Phycisphaerae bacterium]